MGTLLCSSHILADHIKTLDYSFDSYFVRTEYKYVPHRNIRHKIKMKTIASICVIVWLCVVLPPPGTNGNLIKSMAQNFMGKTASAVNECFEGKSIDSSVIVTIDLDLIDSVLQEL